MSKLKGDLSKYSGKENNSRLLNMRKNKQKQRMSSDISMLNQSSLKTPPRIKEENSFEEYKEENHKEFSKNSSKKILEDRTNRNLMQENEFEESHLTKPTERESRV